MSGGAAEKKASKRADVKDRNILYVKMLNKLKTKIYKYLGKSNRLDVSAAKKLATKVMNALKIQTLGQNIL